MDLAAENPVHAALGEVERRLGSRGEIELSILMPCLNEAETLATCIEKATGFLDRSGIAGEVIVADNGSTDASRDIARALGARVVEVAARGYGAALSAGIAAARGRYVIMGDSDDSYDFAALDGFVAKLRQGADLVMGNRFKGGIADQAMPRLHRYLGRKARRRDLLFAIAAVLVGAQLIGFYGLAKLHAVSEGLLPALPPRRAPPHRRSLLPGRRRPGADRPRDRRCGGGALGACGLRIDGPADDRPLRGRRGPGAGARRAGDHHRLPVGPDDEPPEQRRPGRADGSDPAGGGSPGEPRRGLKSAAPQPIDPRRGVARVGDRLEPGRRVAALQPVDEGVGVRPDQMVELGRGRAEREVVDAASGEDRAALVGFRRERRDGVEDAVAIAVIGRGDDAVRGLGEM